MNFESEMRAYERAREEDEISNLFEEDEEEEDANDYLDYLYDLNKC